MGAWKATKPRANPPICWWCDKRLYAGGKAYVLIKDDDGTEHPWHEMCANEQRRGG